MNNTNFKNIKNHLNDLLRVIEVVGDSNSTFEKLTGFNNIAKTKTAINLAIEILTKGEKDFNVIYNGNEAIAINKINKFLSLDNIKSFSLLNDILNIIFSLKTNVVELSFR